MEIDIENVTTRNLQNHSQGQQEFPQMMRRIAVDYLANNDISTQEGLKAFNNFLSGAFAGLHIRLIRSSSLIFMVQCSTLDILEKLWTDYLSGHINKVAESCLVTEKIRRKFDIKSLTLKTSIDKDNYLACRQSFTKRLRKLFFYFNFIFLLLQALEKLHQGHRMICIHRQHRT